MNIRYLGQYISQFRRLHPIAIDFNLVKGWHLSLKQLFQYQTIAELSHFLQYGGERTANQPSKVRNPLRCLVPFSVDHRKIPFFCVHPITGHVHSYYELAQKIQTKYRFIGIQSPMVDIDPPFFNNLETLAQHYVEAVQAEQSHGPYHLGGWSLGGLIAYEMAQILKKQKEEVQCLIIMDKDAYPYPFVHQDEHLLTYLFEEEEVPQEESFLQMNSTDQLNWLLSQHQVKERYNNNDPGWIKQHLEIIRDHIRLMSKHILQPYEGHLTVISSEDTANKTGNDPALGWRKLAKSVRAITVPGNHDSFIQEPLVERLASEILQNSPIINEVNT
ncbi:alpha/beta fold hydrolase [Paenibacillus lentus]|uniref:thioesterase domain-containing protein n=1 Tax=Paenibacillus lentus TaxID=1338368 RepID=UPI0013DE7943|nr:alpha/beta fold hydrolase [Paenibacillus lentus]